MPCVTGYQHWMRQSDTIAVSCVRDDAYAQKIRNAFFALSGAKPHFVTSSATYAGVGNAYKEPHRLGVDRWLALLAIKARGESAAVIIDVGTACTIDVMNNGQHLGGYIFPGIAVARDALMAIPKNSILWRILSHLSR